jgi:predicted  nucleic acid-binding Zn-ribbon protein
MSQLPPIDTQPDTQPSLEALQRENGYLKQRNAQLQSDISDLSAEIDRLRQERERLHGRRTASAPNPLGSGQ